MPFIPWRNRHKKPGMPHAAQGLPGGAPSPSLPGLSGPLPMSSGIPSAPSSLGSGPMMRGGQVGMADGGDAQQAMVDALRRFNQSKQPQQQPVPPNNYLQNLPYTPNPNAPAYEMKPMPYAPPSVPLDLKEMYQPLATGGQVGGAGSGVYRMDMQRKGGMADGGDPTLADDMRSAWNVPGRVMQGYTSDDNTAVSPKAAAIGDAAATIVDPAIKSYEAVYNDPSVPNAANASYQTAVLTNKPLAAAASYGTGLGYSLAKDFGWLDAPTANAADNGLSPDQMKIYNRLIRKQELTPGEQSQLDTFNQIIQRKSTAGVDAESDAARKKRETDAANMTAAIKARDEALNRDMPFENTATGQFIQHTGGLGPGFMAVPFGAFSRAASGAGKSTLGKAMTDYVLPGSVGGLTGVVGEFAPDLYNMNATSPMDPRQEAYSKFVELAPEGPDRDKASKILEGLKKDNPTGVNPLRTAATQSIKDTAYYRVPIGLAEGISGGLIGADMVRAPGRYLRMLGQGGGGNGGGGVPPAIPPGNVQNPPPAVPQRLPGYPPEGDPVRQQIRDRFRLATIDKDATLSPSEGIQEIRNALGPASANARGFSDGSLRKRINETNNNIDDIVRKEGRMPTRGDVWDQKIWGPTTLAIPGSVIVGASQSDDTPYNSGGTVRGSDEDNISRALRHTSGHWEKQKRDREGRWTGGYVGRKK